MNTNIFGLNKKGEYKYEYIRVDKKGRIRIQIQIFGLVFANTNTNTNICHTLVIARYKQAEPVMHRLQPGTNR